VRTDWLEAHSPSQVVARQCAIARAVRYLGLYDVLELQFEALRQPDCPEFDVPEPLPPSVIRFRPRRC
jgi:hypothetical protein